MPWVVLQMYITSSQARTSLQRVSTFCSRVPLPRAALTAAAGRERSTEGVEISVTLRQSDAGLLILVSAAYWARSST